jgi:2-oxoglutarate dehydrogenase E2 component (dihydrolipoamide succinyltransferase)
MVSNGQILELRDDEQSAPKFVVNLESAGAIAPAATTPAKPPVKPAAAKAGAAKAKTGTAAKAPTAAKASAGTSATSNVHQLRPSDKPATAATPLTGEDKRMEILRLLAIKPMMKSEIVQKLGDVEGLLKEMKAEGLVTDSYIISDYTWELTDEAYAKYPELLNPVAPEAPPAPVAAPAAKATEQASLPLEAPATAPAPAPKAPAAKKPAPAPKAPAAKPAAAAAAPAPAPAPAPVAQAPAAAPKAGEINPLSELSMTVAAVVEKLFQERLGDLAAELESKNKQIEESQQLITEIAAGITECTDAFQVAISALNKFAAKINKLA